MFIGIWGQNDGRVVGSLGDVGEPIIAVQTQKWIERASENSKRKLWIFYSLMGHRATQLHDDYVKALNLIDLEFRAIGWHKAANKKVIAAWRALFGELIHAPNVVGDAALNAAWNQRCSDRLVDLLSAMSKALRFDHTEEELRRPEHRNVCRAAWPRSACQVLKNTK